MAVRVQVPNRAPLVRFLLHPAGKAAVATLVVALVLAGGIFTYYYAKFARLIEQRLATGVFPNTSMIFAAPKTIGVGDEATVTEIVNQLRRGGYSESRTNRMGWYHVRPDAIEIFPGPDSYFDNEAGVIKVTGNHVAQIISLRDNTERTQYMLEPEMVTSLFDRKREKRRLVKYADIPKVLVEAVVSAEDKRFFQHSGFDPLRVLKAAYIDVKERKNAQGASTVSMQVARLVWLDEQRMQRTWRRKLAEIMITLQLEQRLSKEEIFEFYANQVPLGQRGSFGISGFGEAAQVFFGKDISRLTLPEAATIAGVIHAPSATNPFRRPERARNRRNVILGMMRENGFINDREYAEAAASPLVLAHSGMEGTDAPYFVDLVNEEVQDQFQDKDFQANSYRIYSTLDVNLQREAAEAVRVGLKESDDALARRRARNPKVPEAQVALVALDPQTGEIKALIGGRNYGASQLNRALAKRQPGSAFKPFVYAAALNTALQGSARVITPASTLVDEPTTFWFDNKPYEPNNFKSKFHGLVTVREALADSMNVPTVKLAEMVGYGAVRELAKKAGMNYNIQATPAIALGAYEVTPIEVAGAYTIFANQGVFVRPNWIKYIRDDRGQGIYDYKPVKRQVLDPRVAYLMVDLLEEVLRSGTGAGVHARGFNLPAAGKTGTSHDGWFAGFTSKLICVVWVGFDDNEELHLEGAHSALPIWAEFMKRAAQYREYRNPKPFDPPEGVVSVEIDPTSGELATPACPTRRPEEFIAGTQPVAMCHVHGGGGSMQVAGWETQPVEPAVGGAPSATAPVQTPGGPATAIHRPPVSVAIPVQPEAQQPEQQKKKGLFGRIRDIFK